MHFYSRNNFHSFALLFQQMFQPFLVGVGHPVHLISFIVAEITRRRIKISDHNDDYNDDDVNDESDDDDNNDDVDGDDDDDDDDDKCKDIQTQLTIVIDEAGWEKTHISCLSCTKMMLRLQLLTIKGDDASGNTVSQEKATQNG